MIDLFYLYYNPKPEPARDNWHSKARLYLQHPEESPELIGVLPYLIHPPSKLSSTASWISFRDKTILPMMQHRPNDKNLPNFLKQVETILTWRASISPENRFWKADSKPADHRLCGGQAP